MKQVLVGVAALLLVAQGAVLAADKAVNVKKLPQAAQTFIAQHFEAATVAYAIKDLELINPDYTVVFSDGQRVEFDQNGAWTDVDVKTGAVPAGIIPEAIRQFVAKNHPNLNVVSIERDKLGYDVSLGGDVELKFDPQGNFVRYDD